jgi:hypothetical protein
MHNYILDCQIQKQLVVTENPLDETDVPEAEIQVIHSVQL